MSSIYREPRSKWFTAAITFAAIGLCASWVGIIQVLRTPEEVKPVVSTPAPCSQCHTTPAPCSQCHTTPANKAARARIIYKLKVTAKTQAALLRELESTQ